MDEKSTERIEGSVREALSLMNQALEEMRSTEGGDRSRAMAARESLIAAQRNIERAIDRLNEYCEKNAE